METISQRIESVRARIHQAAQQCGRDPADIELLAVSKTRPAADIRAAWKAGLMSFGESYLQEALEKQPELTDLPINWHFIGRIQSNKTRPIAEHFDWVHGLCELKHARRFSEQRPEHLSDLNLCIQVNISGEASKAGVSPGEVAELAKEVAAMPRVRLRGLMALPAPTDDVQQQKTAFAQVRALFATLKDSGIALDTLSMGMSADLEAAIGEGSTIVRIGTALFGPRL